MQAGMIGGAALILVGVSLPESIGFPTAVIGALIGALCLAKEWLSRPKHRQGPHF